MGHIRLMRDCDLVLIAPASADLWRKWPTAWRTIWQARRFGKRQTHYRGPSMNAAMWAHPATQANAQTLLGAALNSGASRWRYGLRGCWDRPHARAGGLGPTDR